MHYFLLDDDSNIVQIYISGATSNPMPYFKDFGMGSVGTVHKVDFSRVECYEDDDVKELEFEFKKKKPGELQSIQLLTPIPANPKDVLPCGEYSMGVDLTIEMQRTIKNYIKDIIYDVVDAISLNTHIIAFCREVLSDKTFLVLFDKDRNVQGITKALSNRSRSVLDEIKYCVETYGFNEDYFDESKVLTYNEEEA